MIYIYFTHTSASEKLVIIWFQDYCVEDISLRFVQNAGSRISLSYHSAQNNNLIVIHVGTSKV